MMRGRQKQRKKERQLWSRGSQLSQEKLILSLIKTGSTERSFPSQMCIDLSIYLYLWMKHNLFKIKFINSKLTSYYSNERNKGN